MAIPPAKAPGLFDLRVAPAPHTRLLVGTGALGLVFAVWFLAAFGDIPEHRWISPVILPSLSSRAAWICACAKPKEAERIKAGKFTFPRWATWVAAIDAKHGSDFKGFKASSWNEQTSQRENTNRVAIDPR
jgi:hypothetical protein